MRALSELLESFSRAEESVLVRAAKEREREARRAAVLEASGPRRTSSRLVVGAGGVGGGEEGAGGGAGAQSPEPQPHHPAGSSGSGGGGGGEDFPVPQPPQAARAAAAAAGALGLQRGPERRTRGGGGGGGGGGESSALEAAGLRPGFYSAQVEVPAERRAFLVQHVDGALTGGARLAALEAVLGQDPPALRYVGLPPSALALRPLVETEYFRLLEARGGATEAAVSKHKRRFKEEDRRRREREAKERERSQLQAGRGLEDKMLEARAKEVRFVCVRARAPPVFSSRCVLLRLRLSLCNAPHPFSLLLFSPPSPTPPPPPCSARSVWTSARRRLCWASTTSRRRPLTRPAPATSACASRCWPPARTTPWPFCTTRSGTAPTLALAPTTTPCTP